MTDSGALVLKISIVYPIEMFRDAFNKVQETGSNRDFGTTQAAKMYFSMSNPGPNAFATGETHAPAFQ